MGRLGAGLGWVNSARGRYIAGLVALLLCVGGLYAAKFDHFQVGVYRDDAQYVLLARSIVVGDDLALSTAPGQPQPSPFPFGWSLLLAPVYALFGGALQPLKALALLFTVGSVALILIGWRGLGLRSPASALPVAALYGLSALAVKHASMVMSEPAALFFALAALLLAARCARSPRFQPLDAACLGVACLLAACVRTLGLAAAAAALLYLLIRRRWRELAVAALTAAVALALVLALTAIDWGDLSLSAAYQTQFGRVYGGQGGPTALRLLRRVWRGLSVYVRTDLRDVLIPFVAGPTFAALVNRPGLHLAPAAISALVVALLAWGYGVNLARERLLPAHLYLAFYMGVAVLWPWAMMRMLYGVLPLLFVYLLAGGADLAARAVALARRWPALARALRALPSVALALLLAAHVLASARVAPSWRHAPDLSVGASWLAQHAEPDAVLLCEEPNSVHLYAERATALLPMGVDELRAAAARWAHPYVLIAPALVWASPRQLAYSDNAAALDAALQAGALGATLVFDDAPQAVRVYRLAPTAR